MDLQQNRETQQNQEKQKDPESFLSRIKENLKIDDEDAQNFNFDLTTCVLNSRTFNGSNGQKLGISSNGVNYLLKFPPRVTEKDQRITSLEYSNASITENISCKIYTALGFEAQKTFLARYENQICVVCQDFVEEDYKFQDFASLKNTDLDEKNNVEIGRNTELSAILRFFETQGSLNITAQEFKEHFWNMFVVDSLLMNFDRHNGNWGFLINEKKNIHKFSPIFDCGSALFSLSDEKTMSLVIENEFELNQRVYGKRRGLAIVQNRERILPFKFLTQTSNKECLEALEKIVPRIDLEQLNAIVDETKYTSDLHKKFLKTILRARKEKILDYALENNPNISAKAYLQKALNDFEKAESISNEFSHQRSLK